MNRHDVGRGRGGVEAALASTPVKTIVAGVDSDRLYPLRLQQEIADGLPGADRLRVLTSRNGHDGFLTEAEAVAKLLDELMVLAPRTNLPCRRFSRIELRIASSSNPWW